MLELPPSRGKWWACTASKASLAQLCFHGRGISSKSHCSQILMHIIATWGIDMSQRKVGSQTSPVRADKGAGCLFFALNTPAAFYWKIITSLQKSKKDEVFWHTEGWGLAEWKQLWTGSVQVTSDLAEFHLLKHSTPGEVYWAWSWNSTRIMII